METIVVSIIALLLFIYLFVAMIRPKNSRTCKHQTGFNSPSTSSRLR